MGQARSDVHHNADLRQAPAHVHGHSQSAAPAQRAPYFEVRDDDANVGCCGFAFVSTQNIEDGQWHHLALVRQGPSIVLFIDGAPAPGTTFTQGTTVDLSSPGYTSQTFALGASLPFSLFYSGLMDEFRIYDRALSAAEVQNLYAPSNQPPDVSGAVPSIATIRPPNNKMVSIDIVGVTDPDGDPASIQITAITNNEPAARMPPASARRLRKCGPLASATGPGVPTRSRSSPATATAGLRQEA